MTLTYPVAAADFFDLARILEVDCHLGEAMEYSVDGGGGVTTSQRGERLWRGQVALTTSAGRDQAKVQAYLAALRGPGASFMIGDPGRAYPASDPDGTTLGAAAVTVDARVDAWQVRLTGAPSSYILSTGDHLSIQFASGRYSYHEIVSGDAFVGTPPKATVRVVPDLPVNVTQGDAVALVRPALKARYVPNSFSAAPLRPADLRGPQSFAWIQTHR